MSCQRRRSSSSSPGVRQIAGDLLAQAVAHLARGLEGEGHGDDAAHRRARRQQMQDARHQRARLACARAGDEHDIAVDGRHRRRLVGAGRRLLDDGLEGEH
jgi:hypothetical protein